MTVSLSDAHRLLEIKDQMKDLLEEAIGIARGTGEYERARAYWYGHIRMALDNDHHYLGSGGYTMEQTAESLISEAEDDEDEGEE